MDHVLEALTEVLYERAGMPVPSLQEIQEGIAQTRQLGLYHQALDGLPQHILDSPSTASRSALKQDLHAFYAQNPDMDHMTKQLMQQRSAVLSSHAGLLIEGEVAEHKAGERAAQPKSKPTPKSATPHAPEPHLAPQTPAAAKESQSWLKRLGKEKWMGKKGLAVVGGAAALGAVLYGAKKLLSHDQPPASNWQQRVGQPVMVSDPYTRL